ncbi:acyltransferase [Pedobacter frigidisoli]|uniref:Acyltransferase n=1 Tax=Pedobacter frigidisoli TaxID=2530455 RepID=A0A4R0NZ31_9SPHI|nr:acyltransferase [Pedobacter frigidisoli]TCD07719.1 acyltransferase [Pedobacter frigidisoli]
MIFSGQKIDQEKAHINSADWIRAIAALMVTVFHLGGKTQPILNLGWLGVQAFFVLSGFIICWSLPMHYSYNNLARFIWKRVIRIEPPYIISIVLMIMLNFIIEKNYQIDWLDIVAHLGYLNNFLSKDYLNPVYWTLGIEFQFYLFIAFMFPIIVKPFGNGCF